MTINNKIEEIIDKMNNISEFGNKLNFIITLVQHLTLMQEQMLKEYVKRNEQQLMSDFELVVEEISKNLEKVKLSVIWMRNKIILEINSEIFQIDNES